MASTIPLPTNLKVFRGTAQPCRINEKEPKVPKRKIKMPKGLSKDEQKQWHLVADNLEQSGILTVLDTQALTLYCRAYVKWCEANSKLDKSGAVVKNKADQPVISPFFKVSIRYFDQMITILREFGMTPASRTRIRVENKEKDDDFAAWSQQQKEKRRIAREGL